MNVAAIKAVVTLLGAALLTGCNANDPIAYGPESEIAAATRAARLCGMLEIRHDPLDDENSLLKIGARNTSGSIRCTRQWIRANAPEIELTRERAEELGL